MTFEVKNYLKKILSPLIVFHLRVANNFIKNPAFRPPKQFFALYKLNYLMYIGQVAIIPVGFRCFTKTELYPRLGISQATLPFDNGFFPPQAVSKILEKQHVDLKFSGHSSHAVCIKHEFYHDCQLGLGIKFETSTYNEINELAKSEDQKDLNKYLDSSRAYYTLDLKNNYVLAHYNWHKFSDTKHSNGNTDPEYNLARLNELINKRIKRLLDMCSKAEIILFVYDETQGYNFMAIDDICFGLADLEPIKTRAKAMFGTKALVIQSKYIKSPHHMVKIIKEKQSEVKRSSQIQAQPGTV
jgi:hypothetical protein